MSNVSDDPVRDAGDPDQTASAQCEPESIEAFPAGEPVWTQEQIDACAEACPSAEPSCRHRRCEGSEDHDACVLDSLDACLSQPDALCRGEWEEYSCCSLSCEGKESSENGLLSCIMRQCAEQLAAYGDCTDMAVDDEDPCVAEADRACVAP